MKSVSQLSAAVCSVCVRPAGSSAGHMNTNGETLLTAFSMFNRHGVGRALLQSPLLLIN